MSTPTTHQLFLLSDHLKLSLLERQRAISLNLEPHKQDAHITRTLTSLQEGIEALESQQSDLGQAEDATSDLSRLRKQYDDLYAQFHGSAPPSEEMRRPNDPSLAATFEAAQARPEVGSRRGKSVRFRDNPNEEDPVAVANRAALFSDTERYRDEPDPPDQSQLDNQQIHAYHKQVLRDQDEQLDSLGQSVGRQRVLGIQMGNELDEQNELLEDVESGVDRHTTTLDRARKRLGHVARKSKDNWSWVTIGILILILVLLIVVLK
jgi:syntaxin 8